MKMIVAAAGAAAVLTGFASAETRDVGNFDAVGASGRFRVEIAIGPHYSVDVSGEDGARIRTRIEDGTLKIEPSNRPWFGPERRYDALVRITAPRLDGVAGARGNELSADLAGACADFDVASAMGANVHVTNAQCADIDASAAMGGELEIAGTCENLDASAAMGGVIDAGALRCARVDASAAMGGDIDAYADVSFDASAAMGGAVNVAGKGAQHDRSTAMGGSVTRRETP